MASGESNRNGDGKSAGAASRTTFIRAPTLFIQHFGSSVSRRDIRTLVRLVCVFLALVVIYSIAFQFLMAMEGQSHSWISGFYWTLTAMSTVGFGDITFTSDAGRLFSIVVLLSGIVFMLVLLPFTFIEFFYEPWIEANLANRVPKSLPADTSGHVILTFYGPVASLLIEKLKQFHYPYVIVLPEVDEVLRLDDLGIRAVCGALDDPETYRAVRVEQAAMVASTRTDIVNVTVVSTVRAVSDSTRIVATARDEASVEVLNRAGCTRVLRLTELTAEALARRVSGGDRLSHVIGRIDDLVIAEIDADRTTLIGKRLEDVWQLAGPSVVGQWARGHFEIGRPESTVEKGSVLVMAGTPASIREFDALSRDDDKSSNLEPVVIIGGGRVGRATAAALERRGIDFRIIEQLPDRIRDPDMYVLGSGADQSVLEKAGFSKTPTVVVTTGDDEMNVYLTINCRLLRQDVQIISRASTERSVATLHRAGSDFVMSYASMGANSLFNLLQRSDLLMIAEGLDVFKVQVPPALAGKTLSESAIRRKTGCSIIGIDARGRTLANPPPETRIPKSGEIVLIGTPAGETEFLRLFSSEN